MKNSDRIKLKLPVRFHIDVMDIQKLNVGEIGGGGIGIAIDMNNFINIEVIENDEDIINGPKPKLISHYTNLMRDVLKTDLHFKIEFELDKNLKEHNGMGSNALIQVGVMYGINYLLNYPLEKEELIKIMHESYCEICNEKISSEVYCSGVAHNVLMYGGVCFIDDRGKLIYSKKFPSEIKVALLKANFEDMFNVEGKDYDEIITKLRPDNDNTYSKQKRYIIKNIVIPQLKNNKYSEFFNSMRKIYKTDNTNVLSNICKIGNLNYNQLQDKLSKIPNLVMKMSSNSPYVCILTDQIEELKKVCKEHDIQMKIYTINNCGIEEIEVIEKYKRNVV